MEHTSLSLLRRARGDVLEQFASENIGITACDARACRDSLGQMQVCVGPMVTMTEAGARRSLRTLNDAFLMGGSYDMFSLTCKKELSYHMPLMPWGHDDNAPLTLLLLMHARATPQAHKGVIAPADVEHRYLVVNRLVDLFQGGFAALFGLSASWWNELAPYTDRAAGNQHWPYLVETSEVPPASKDSGRRMEPL